MARTAVAQVRTCLAQARENARAARTALTVEVWEAINRAWLMIHDRTSPGGVQATLNLVEELEVGAALQVGPRPLNPRWLNPHDQEAHHRPPIADCRSNTENVSFSEKR